MSVVAAMGDLDEHRRLVVAGTEAVEVARSEGVLLRALGGVAVAVKSPAAAAGGPLARSFSDLDFVTNSKHKKGTITILTELGYAPRERFNAAHGESRLLFDQPDGRHVDVFVDRFSLCHELQLKDRLDVDDLTIPLADLLLTKLQVAKLALKDVTDAVAILLDHSLSSDDAGINVGRVTSLLANDWGWWRTSTETLQSLDRQLASLALTPEQVTTARERLRGLVEAIEGAPKSLRWRARARIGERRPWREDPDEMEA